MKYRFDTIKEKSLLATIYSMISIAYLGLFCIFFYYRYMQTTMFEIKWMPDFYQIIQLWLWRLTSAKIIVDIWANKVNAKKAICMSCAFAVFFVCWKTTQVYDLVLEVACFMIGLNDIDYKIILKLYLFISVPITIYTIVASQLGIVTNLIHYREGHIRVAFGFIYPTDFAAHIFFIFCAYILLRQCRISFFEIGAMIATAIFLKLYCDARCSVMSIVMLAVGIWVLKMGINRNRLLSKGYKKENLFLRIVPFAPFAFAIGMTVLGYTKFNNQLYVLLNKLLSNRISISRQAFLKYNVNLFGQYVYMNGNGGRKAGEFLSQDQYFFIDCSYVNILLRYGLLVLLVILMAHMYITKKNNDNYYIVYVVFLVCVHSIIEHHLIEYVYNFFIVFAFVKFKSKSTNTKIYTSMKETA